MNELQKLILDTKRYRLIDILTQPSWWVVLNFRIAAFLWRLNYFSFLYYIYFPIWRLISIITGVEIYGKTEIGGGLKVIHFGQIFINPKTVIGKNCLIYNNVSIGSSDYESGPCPVLRDNVKIGVGARILGAIEIGHGCRIGANSVVIDSFPDDSLIIGIPAKNGR
ncbi:MAG: serine acetyltransferase [bacterium]|nr:serine acetyltransferase [bacterium]